MRILELFCGTKSFTKVAEARGHECRTLDNGPRFEPTYCMDIMDFNPVILDGWHPDVVWASPPCQCFSVMVIGKNWEKKRVGIFPRPKRPQTELSMKVVERTIAIIKELRPAFYFIENPRGMLRKMRFMQGLGRSTVTYCQYGFDYQKATDIWNNCIEWKPKPICSNRSPCHQRAPAGSHYGLQGIGRRSERPHIHPVDWHSVSWHSVSGWNKATVRAIVPPKLCEEIIMACERAI